MKRSTAILVIALIFLTFMQITTPKVLADTQIMPATEIVNGMKGVGKTVVNGVKVEEFAVEVLGILQDSNQELILVKVSGPVIDQTGGIAAGMSGSPVYIDGMLIGAIGYGWSLTDHRVGLITPIESMLKILDLNRESGKAKRSFQIDFDSFQSDSSAAFKGVEERIVFSEPVNFENRVVDQIYFCESYQSAVQLTTNDSVLKAYPVKTPLLINGIKGRALDRLMRGLTDFDVIPIQTGSSNNSKEVQLPVLEPGSGISVQLVQGDIEVSSIGTLTYIQDEEILAFGHPFMNQGQVEYFLSGAKILAVVDNLDMPFKLGVPTGVVGTITQDRSSGIAGKVGMNPKIIPVNVLVEDFDLQSQQEFQFQVIRNEELVMSLVIPAILQTIDTAIDRQGYGTSKLRMEIVGDKLPNQLFSYENMYYSSIDIAADSLNDLYNILTYIITNPFVQVNIGSIDISLQVEQIRQYALIEEVKLLNDQLCPGDTAQIQVTLQPYRTNPYKLTYEVQIPENIQTGPASLTVASGIYGSYVMPEEYQDEERVQDTNHVEGEHYKSLEEILKMYSVEPKNNDLVIEIMPYYVDVMVDDESGMETEPVMAEPNEAHTSTGTKNNEAQNSEKDAKGNVKDDYAGSDSVAQTVKKYFPTEYVLDGSLTMEITILEKGDPGIEVFTEERKLGNTRVLESGAQI